jgi:hypothetical protein
MPIDVLAYRQWHSHECNLVVCHLLIVPQPARPASGYPGRPGTRLRVSAMTTHCQVCPRSTFSLLTRYLATGSGSLGRRGLPGRCRLPRRSNLIGSRRSLTWIWERLGSHNRAFRGLRSCQLSEQRGIVHLVAPLSAAWPATVLALRHWYSLPRRANLVSRPDYTQAPHAHFLAN